MSEYVYKGFKVHFDIKQSKKESHPYSANGRVICYVNGHGPTLTQKFKTEGPSKKFVRQEIKKLINNYIEFEWNQYIEQEDTHKKTNFFGS